MSHEIYKWDKVTCADGKGTWHNINTHNVDSMETFESTNLDWHVNQYPLCIEKDGNKIDIPDNFVTLREDINLPLGVVGNQYRVIQNEQVYNAIQNIFDGHANLVTAGSLFNCRQIWFLAELDNGFQIINKDIYQNYLLASSSHDGSRKLEFRLTQVRVVCNNTLTAAVNNTSDCFQVPHTDISEYRIVQAERFYDEVFNGIDKTKKTLEILAEKPCDMATAYNWATGFIKATTTKSQNIARRIVQLYSEGKGNNGETRYDLLNGLTERFTHGEGDKDNDGRIKQFISSTFGTSSGRKVHAMAVLENDEKFEKTARLGASMNKTYLESEAAAKTTSLISIN